MKRAFLTILFFMSLLPCIVYAEELFLYISDGQWGYATDDGTVVICIFFRSNSLLQWRGQGAYFRTDGSLFFD
jgi:hypothetical protein